MTVRTSMDTNAAYAMKPFRRRPGSWVHRRRGFTLVELLIASSVAMLIGGTTMLMLIESAKENRRGLADSTVEQAAGALQQKIIQQLRSMSASEGVAFSSPVTSGSGTLLGYKSIIVAQGQYPDYPRQQISFNPTTKQVVYNSNLSSTNATVNLARGNSNAVVRQLRFSPSLKSDSTVDNALVNVSIEMDDNGFSRRAGSSYLDNPAYVRRTFSVRMRNN